jgi:iron complex transport system substrate-binding protein
MKQYLLILIIVCLAWVTARSQQRIVSLNGTISEMLCDLGLEQQIVGVDITSNYPASLKSKPQVGHNMNISAEGVLALQPTLVMGMESQFSDQLSDQLKAAGIKTVTLKQEYSIAGTRRLLEEVAAITGTQGRAAILLQQFDQQIAGLKITSLNKKVLFIYARGAGTLMVSGTGTPLDKIIRLAGAENAVQAFSDFKPLSAESLVSANPDMILLFSSGLQSVGGTDGLLKIPGIAQTSAGQHKKIISMDGELISGFGLRLPQAIRELHSKMVQIANE